MRQCYGIRIGIVHLGRAQLNLPRRHNALLLENGETKSFEEVLEDHGSACVRYGHKRLLLCRGSRLESS